MFVIDLQPVEFRYHYDVWKFIQGRIIKNKMNELEHHLSWYRSFIIVFLIYCQKNNGSILINEI